MIEKLREEGKERHILGVLIVLGFLTFLIGLVQSPQRAWANLLLGNYYCISLAIYGTVFIALMYLFNSGWGVLFRRVPEAMSFYLPVGALLMLALYFGRAELYPWARPGEESPLSFFPQKSLYLNTPFFFLRMVVALGLWILFSYRFRYHSQQQDKDGDLLHTQKNKILSIPFLLLFAVTFIYTSFDWLMSLEPNWYSTIFPAYCFAGLFLGGTSAMIILILYFQGRGFLSGITSHHLYELGRVLCASSLFWAYIYFSQYMLIYYTNIPEEAKYYAERLRAVGSLPILLNIALNWVIPQGVLIPDRVRRSARSLFKVSAVVLLGRWLDLYLLIMPAVGLSFRLGLPEVFIFLGVLSLFLLLFLVGFQKSAPVPQKDPYLVESLHFQA